MGHNTTNGRESEKNVSCRNINIIVNYVKQHNKNTNYLLSNLSWTPKYLTDEKNWIPLHVYNEIMNRAINILEDHNAPYKIGMSALLLESWGLFKYVQKVFLAITVDPLIVYKKVSEYNPLFNNTKKVELIRHDKSKCILKIKFNDDVNPLNDYHSDAYIRGMLSSIPQNFNLPPAKVTVLSNESDLILLLDKFGSIPKEKINFRDDLLLIDNKIIGKKIYKQNYDVWSNILFKNHDHEHLIIDEDLFIENLTVKNDGSVGILITKDFIVNKNITLNTGEIYSAHHFMYNISWNRPTFLKKIKHVFSHVFISREAREEDLSTSLSAIKDYIKILEQRVDDKTNQLNSAKIESEYWRNKADELLSTMLPKHIMPAMIRGKLQTEEVYGSIMFIDIVNFTEYTKNNSDNQANEYLQKYFSEISQITNKHGGWVNKFMGDGALVIFGLNKSNSTAHSAIISAVNILNILNNYPWQVRVGIATGLFITGEYGDSNLRRFDCVGHTINLCSRLQSFAGPNQIIVCSNTYNTLKDSEFNFNEEMNFDAKGIGEIKGRVLIF